jgi:hypothetical protein
MEEREIRVDTANRIHEFLTRDPEVHLLLMRYFESRIVELGLLDPALKLRLYLGDKGEDPLRYLLEKVALGHEKTR